VSPTSSPAPAFLFRLCAPSSSPITHSSIMHLPEIVWESYHSDGRLRNTPLPSTIHGWLTKMRGTLLDNEKMRSEGIKEMKQAAVVHSHRQKAAAELKKRNLARREAGKPPLQPLAKQPLLRLSFLRNKPKPIDSRLVATARKSPSSHTHKRKAASSSSRPRHPSSGGKRGSKRPHASRKPSHASHRSKRHSRK